MGYAEKKGLRLKPGSKWKIRFGWQIIAIQRRIANRKGRVL